MTLEEKITELYKEQDEEKQQHIYEEIAKDLFNLDSVFIGLSDKKIVDDDSKRKPGAYILDEDKRVISIFTRIEYAEHWAKKYNREIGIIERGFIDKFINTLVIAKLLSVPYVAINEETEVGILVRIDDLLKINNLDANKYLIMSDDNLQEDGSLKLAFENVDKLDIEAYKESKKKLN